MSKRTGISWTDATWNPVTGCTPVSEGCTNCYARAMAKRIQATGNQRYKEGFKVTLHSDRLEEPQRWRKPRRIFVVSMGDLFHEDVPNEFLQKVFDAIAAAHWHDYFVLTKRASRMADFLQWGSMGSKIFPVWFGITAENQVRFDQRISAIARLPVRTFVSFEPLLGPISIDGWQHAVNWVIVGGETGHHSRKMNPDWARSLRDQCMHHGIPFHFKQHSGPWPGYKPELDGVSHKAIPSFTNATSSRNP